MDTTLARNKITNKAVRGKLTESDAACIDAAIDPTDIALSIEEATVIDSLSVSHGFIGARVRGGFPFNARKLVISDVKNDALQCWSARVSIEYLDITHNSPCIYGDGNHPDCAQFFAKSLKTFKLTSLFKDLYIGYAKCKVVCDDERDKKNGFIFSEICTYENINLFSLGIDFDSNSSAPYFLDMTNATNAVIGSELQPIDPERVSHKAIRIGSTKKGVPKSRDVTIHAYEGQEIVTQGDVELNITRYKKENIEMKRMSIAGIQRLVDSEGSEARVYLDQAGLPTIGVGHLLDQSELSSGKIELSDGSIIDFRNNRALTPSEIRRLLKSDLPKYEKPVNELVKVELSQDNFDALVHFVFNIGVTAFKNSTLLKRVNAYEYKDVPEQLMRWIYVTINGEKQVSDGLVNRRETEVDMWSGGDSINLDRIIPNEQVGHSKNSQAIDEEMAVTERIVYEQEAIEERAIKQYKESNTQGWFASRTNKSLLILIAMAVLSLAAQIFGLPMLDSPEVKEAVTSLINGSMPSAALILSIVGIVFRNKATKFIK